MEYLTSKIKDFMIYRVTNIPKGFWLWYKYYKDRPPQRDYSSRLKISKINNSLENSYTNLVLKEYKSINEIYKDNRMSCDNFRGFVPVDALLFKPRWHYSFWPLAKQISALATERFFNPSFLELGCGCGSLFYFLFNMGHRDYLGIDINPLIFKFSPFVKKNPSFFRIYNLCEEIKLQENGATVLFNVIISVEVMEHIPEERIGNFLKTVCNHMYRESIFIATISKIAGDCHVLVKKREWWLSKFREFSLLPIKDESIITRLTNSHSFNWNEKTSYVFVLQR